MIHAAVRLSRGWGGALAVILVVGGCAGLPRPGGPTIAARAEAESAALAKRVPTHDDPRLAEYLASVAARLSRGRGEDVRIVVLADPSSGAFMLPDGRFYVHTGLLSRIDNEAQLATIIARELARRPAAAALGARPAPALDGPLPRGDLGPTAAAILGHDLRLAAVAAIRGYGPGPEREADVEALRLLGEAGYDRAQALKLFERLAGGAPAGGPLEVFLHGNGPRMAERYETVRGLLGAGPPATDAADPVFERRMLGLVRDNAALDVRAGRFGLAQARLDRVLATTPDDAIALVYAGDLARLRSQRAPGAGERAALVRQAMARYERALAIDPAYAEPWRQLGLLHFQERDAAGARAALAEYLSAAPDAPDARRIREYLAIVGE